VPTPAAPAWLGPNQILATNLNAVTSASFAQPDKVSTDYTLKLTLTGANGPTDTAQLLFTGHLNATFYNYQGTDGKQHTYFNAAKGLGGKKAHRTVDLRPWGQEVTNDAAD
jgi:hypothetical protein